jgi:hypothetical protein
LTQNYSITTVQTKGKGGFWRANSWFESNGKAKPAPPLCLYYTKRANGYKLSASRYPVSDVCCQQLVVLNGFAMMISCFVASMFALIKKVLPNCVKPYIIKVFTQLA